ncbi:hypothetical protein TEA_020576 [Camellia sinensis var. sinensis]|uniref:Uncharacterized protein n=1 Tax=Camellia sinensis var. sinensis TaxID=542762 RepID=A0A4S4EEG5_CAMSN|nr:hypothetical protein TEA_020576 [Camellia sinensis var. sinensis]
MHLAIGKGSRSFDVLICDISTTTSKSDKIGPYGARDHIKMLFCQGVNCSDGVSLSHKLFRCAASMQVCPTTTTWFCLCCQRQTSKALFRMPSYPSDFKISTESSRLELLSKPLSPFVGYCYKDYNQNFSVIYGCQG